MWSVKADSLEDRGRFPLGVEAVTLAHAAALVPAVTAGTYHARYYALHARVAADVTASAAESGDPEALVAARHLMRRSEVILGAISARHSQESPAEHGYGEAIAPAHGEGVLGPRLRDAGPLGSLSVGDLERRYSLQASGFHTVYRGAEIALGLIQRPQLPQLGPTRFSAAALSTLDPVLELAGRDSIAVAELDALAGSLCLCRVRDQLDGAELRRILFDPGSAPHGDARSVRTRMMITTTLVMRALTSHGHGMKGELTAIEDLFCYGPTLDTGEAAARIGARWRGALLRNYLVTAWRRLWHDLTERLPATVSEVAESFTATCIAAAGGDLTVRQALIDVLPARGDRTRLLPAERVLAGRATPLDDLRTLALAAARQDDLTGVAQAAFLAYPGTLDPGWAASLVDQYADRRLSDLTRDLARLLIARAQRIARSRSRWDAKGLHLPTRLRPVGEVLYLSGEEGSIPASLRLERLIHLLVELGILTHQNGRWMPGPHAGDVP
jgi:hypothetical protein